MGRSGFGSRWLQNKDQGGPKPLQYNVNMSTTHTLRLGVLGSTRGTDMQAIIDAIGSQKLKSEIRLVVSNKKDAFILERARNHHLKTFLVDYTAFSSREEAEKCIVKQLQDEQVDLVLLIGWMKIFTSYFVQAYKGRIWNIHPSLLPKYSGGMDLNVHKVVLENKEKETGCTLHEVTEKVDAGRIIMQKSVEIDLEHDTPETLRDKVQKLEQECFIESLQMVIDGKLSIGTQ